MTNNHTDEITQVRNYMSVIMDTMRAVIKAVNPLLRAMVKAVARLGRALKAYREARERERMQTYTVGVRVHPYVDTDRTYYGIAPQVMDRRPAVSHRLNY